VAKTLKKLAVVGAGGHARSVLDIALQNADYEIVGCIDPVPGEVLGIPVIGGDSDLETLPARGVHCLFIALGDNRRRHILFDRALSLGFELVNIVSRQAVISPRVKLGAGICVMAGAILNVNTVVNDNCIINTACSIDHDCVIGKSSHVAPGVALSGTVHVGEGVHIGTGAAIIDRMSIGNWTYVGAGAVVVHDLPASVMAYGVPAKVIRKLTD
jgi:UDP-perosamine 4-acetyltransferase